MAMVVLSPLNMWVAQAMMSESPTLRLVWAVLLTLFAGTQCRAQTPSILPNGIVPLYSTATTIQPGEFASIFGTNLASSTVLWNGNFPLSLGGTRVTINGKAAYLLYVSPGQINLQAPDDPAMGSVPVVVTTSNGSATSTVTLGQFAPSFSLLDDRHVAGVIIRSNGTGAYGNGSYDILGPTGNSLGYATVAAKPGDNIELFALGLGPTLPFVPAGAAFSGAAPTANPVTLFIDNVNVTPSFTGISSAGLYQINLTVPTGLGTGDLPLVAAVGGLQTPSNVFISLQGPEEIQSLTLSTNSVVSGGTVTGKIALYGAATSGSEVVTLSTGSSNAVTMPATVTVPAGSASATFTITAGTVSSRQTVIITASFGGSSTQASLTIAPPGTSSCANISGAWNASETGSANETLDATGEAGSEAEPIEATGNVTFTQTGCSVQLNPIPGGELLGTTSSLVRTGTVSGNNVTLTGEALLTAAVEAEIEAGNLGLNITSVNTVSNIMNASGQLSGDVLPLSETGTFSASGTFSYEGVPGTYTLAIATSSTTTFSRAANAQPSDHSVVFQSAGRIASASSVEIRVMPDLAFWSTDDQRVVSTLLRAAFQKALQLHRNSQPAISR
jgi:uncharacterized protein (TIGR03437 family)